MPEDSRNLPVPSTTPIDRAALERVLARAVQLQSSEGEQLEVFTEQHLVDIGKEVGISAVHIRQAIAEERTRVTVAEESGGITRSFGPARIGASRMVRGTAAGVLQSVDKWMEKEELLQVKRRLSDRITWEPRRDFLGSVKRGFNIGGRGYALSDAFEVAGTVSQMDEQNVLVQLTADYSTSRRRAIWRGAATAGTLAAAAGGLMAVALSMGGSLIIAGAISTGVAGIGGVSFSLFARSNRELVLRGQLALEQALDRIEHRNEPPPSVLGSLLDAAVRELK